MANWNDLFGGGGFVARFISTRLVVASGASGDLITLTPPGDQKVRLVTLLGATFAATQPNISIEIDGNDIITSKILGGSANATDEFIVGFSDSDATAIARHPFIEGDIGETLKVILTSGTTGTDINYAYEFGE